MKGDFYTLKFNNVIIAISHSRKILDSLHVKLKQNSKYAKGLIRHKRVIVLPEEESKAQKIINSIKEGN